MKVLKVASLLGLFSNLPHDLFKNYICSEVVYLVVIVVNFVLALFGADFYPVFFTSRIDLPFRSFVTFRLTTIKGVILLILRHFLRSHRRSMNSVGLGKKVPICI